MSSLIKGSLPGMQVVCTGKIRIKNEIELQKQLAAEKAAEALRVPPSDVYLGENFGGDAAENPKNMPEIEQPYTSLKELENLRQHYIADGESVVLGAKKQAAELIATARDDAERVISGAKLDASQIAREASDAAAREKETAKRDGYEEGYAQGEKKGEEDGYLQGLKKCKETMTDLKQLCADINAQRDNLIESYKSDIFELALAIAEKITVKALAAKDKKMLERMVGEAAKDFHNAKTIRVTLSKLDLSEDVDVDLALLEKCFAPTAQVEFEVLPNAESGTLILDNGSEILDASVSTQLKMIEELGRGRFRDKTDEEMKRPASRTKKAAKPAAAEPEQTADAPPASEQAPPKALSAEDLI